MVENDQEGAGPGDSALQGGPSKDAADADGLGALDPTDEVVAHGVAELGLEVAGPEGEHLGDVLGGRPVIEGRDGDGEVADEVEHGRLGLGEGAVTEEVADRASSQRSGDDDGDRRGDAASVETPQSLEEERGETHRPTLHRAHTVSWALAALLAAVAVGATLLGALADPSERDRREDLLEVGRRVTVGITSYDYNDLDASRDAVLADALPSFELQYAQLLDESGLSEALRSNEAVATGEIEVGPMVASWEDHEARLFSVVAQKVEGKQTEPTTQRLRVEVTLVETPDGWRASNVEVT